MRQGEHNRRLVYSVFMLLMLGLGSSDSLRGIFSAVFQKQFQLDNTQLGLIVTVSYAGNLVFLLLGSRFSNQFRPKRVRQVLIWMLALAIFTLTRNYIWLLVGMLLVMGSSTLLNTLINLFTPILFTASPGFFVSFLFFIQGIGTSGSQSLMGIRADNYNFWQQVNLGLLLLGALSFFLLLGCQLPATQYDRTAKPGCSLSWRLLLPLILIFGFYCIAEHRVLNWMVVYATRYLNLSQAAAARYLALFFLGVMAGRLLLSPLIDKLGLLRCLRLFALLGSAFYVVGAWGGARTILIWSVSGFFIAIIYPTLVMMIRLYFRPEQVNRAAGLIISMGSLADILFNLLFGQLIDKFGYGSSIRFLPLSMLLFLGSFYAFTTRVRPLEVKPV
ncbi:MFS transporter [Oscillospiraceae bacterium HV4-5-C5C]|nr:MFS transporter [Oscillospiraceae bacterium HV4-5-C5C]